jgi:hypothetical protein
MTVNKPKRNNNCDGIKALATAPSDIPAQTKMDKEEGLSGIQA